MGVFGGGCEVADGRIDMGFCVCVCVWDGDVM